VDEGHRIVEEVIGPPHLEVDTRRPGGELFWHDDLLGDYQLSFGAAGNPGNGATTWRIDGAARLGARAVRFGQPGDVPTWSTGLGLLGGLGFSVTGAEAWFRPELGLTLDWQRVLEPVRGHILPTGARYALDLTVAPLVGLEQGYHGAELGLALRHGALGGVYSRLALLDAEGPTWMWSAGVTAGTEISAYLTIVTLLTAALVAAAVGSIQDGFQDILGGG
jgi:hypothetical protein